MNLGSMTSTPGIRSSDLTKRYGDTLAVDALDLSIPEGTVYGFLDLLMVAQTLNHKALRGLKLPAPDRQILSLKR